MTETLTPQREIEAPRELEAQPPPPPRPGEVRKPRTPTVADVLERAADLIEEFGWASGSNGLAGDPWAVKASCGKPIPMCILGAVARARLDFGDEFDLDGEVDPYEWALEPLAAAGRFEYDHDAYSFNDASGRTSVEVCSTLRAAASSARTKEEA